MVKTTKHYESPKAYVIELAFQDSVLASSMELSLPGADEIESEYEY